MGITFSRKQLLARLDGRILLPLAMGLGIFVWRCSATGLILHLALALAAVALVCSVRREGVRMALLLLRFVCIWTLLVWLAGMWQGVPDDQALTRALLLAGRLGVLGSVGLILGLALSARSLGLALCWYLRPVLGKHAWKPGLALALMIHFLPMCLAVFTDLKRTMVLRNVSWIKRLSLIPPVALRILAGRTYKQALAVSARNLDRPETWTLRRPLSLPGVALGCMALVTSWSLSLL